MIHDWKAKNLLFPMMCHNVNLDKSFGNYELLNTRSTAKNLHSRRDHNLSAWNQYYRPSCMSLVLNVKATLYRVRLWALQPLLVLAVNSTEFSQADNSRTIQRRAMNLTSLDS